MRVQGSVETEQDKSLWSSQWTVLLRRFVGADMAVRQTTLRDSVEIQGHGVHSGSPARMILHPADPGHGIAFLRTGLEGGRERIISANHRLVCATELCTMIGEPNSGSVATIEHLLAAITGMGLDNVFVEIDGPEVPIVDGSAWPFVEAIESVGIVQQRKARRFLKVLKPVRVEMGRAYAELKPADRGFSLDVEIDFSTSLIGRQRRQLHLEAESFRAEIARARTFGFMKDVERLWKAGLALGASLDNTIALGDDRVLNPEGLRFRDEFVRHKLLDAIGDLTLAGAPILGAYRSYCGGHKLNVMALEALFADRSAYAFVESAVPVARGARAELSSAIPAPVFAADQS